MKKIISLLLLLITLLAVQTVHAASTFTVTNTSGTSKFVITRTTNTSTTETVKYRTVSLSAIAGMHFTEKVGELTFDATHNSREVEVTENTPGTAAYLYQNGTSRKYRFEVLDQGGFRLAYTDRTITTGTSVPSSGAFDIKDVTIQENEYTANDAGYDKNGYKSVASSSYFNKAAPKAYYQFIGAQLRMTLSMQAKENDDAYEYLQLLVDNTSTCDNRDDCSNGDPGNISSSKYMAGFEMNTGSKDDTYRSYTFPVLSAGHNEGAANPWSHGDKWPLKKQKFNGNRATDGRIIIPTAFNTLVLRLNASGSSGSDEWAVKNVKAHIQAVDGTAPSRLGDPVISGSMHAKGNTFYVSVPFDEIVTVSGTPTLSTTWGSASYVSSNGGSGSNVLTFSGTITASAGTALTVNSISGTIKDLAGNELSSAGKAINKNIGITVDANHSFTITYDLADGTVVTANPDSYTYETATFTLKKPIRAGYTFAGWTGSNGNTPQTTVTIPAGSHGDKTFTANWTPIWGQDNGKTGDDEDHAYVISSTDGLDMLAKVVNGTDGYTANTFEGKFFKLGADITYTHISEWNNANSTENNYTAIGRLSVNKFYTFKGTFDGDGYTVSGIRIYKKDATDANSFQGLFGRIGEQGIVRNITLDDSRITGDTWSGGIAGNSVGTVDNCHVTDQVLIHTLSTGDMHGGIAGRNSGLLQNSTSAATLSANSVNAKEYGGIAGYNLGTVQNCLAVGTSISSQNQYVGAIVGVNDGGTLVSNYYRNCTVGSTANAINVGVGGESSSTDQAGARSVHTLTLVDGVTASGESVIIGSYTYYASNTTVTLGYSQAVAQQITYHYNDGSDHDITGNTFTMPASDVTISVTFTAAWSGAGTKGSPYLITTPEQLDLLAKMVNGTDGYTAKNFSGTHFKLGTNIEYTGDSENYTAIGSGSNPFNGTFNGDGKVVSGIRINQGGTDYHGLFGHVGSSGTVKNVILADAVITGGSNTGAVVGNNAGTLSANYYHDCTVNNQTTNIGTSSGDCNGTRSVHALTLPADVTTSGESVEIGSNTYYASNTAVTLGYSQAVAQQITYHYNDGSDHDITGNTFTMPASDVTISVTFTTAWSGGGSSDNPYLIITTDQLDLLAKMVNGTNGYTANKFRDTYFRLDNDITYTHTTEWNDANSTEDNYTAIGKYHHSFGGVFDGGDHTISGIRIYMSGSDDVDNLQGLFGVTFDGTVKNVTLTDARITGYKEVGGIIGEKNYGLVENCLASGANVSGNSNVGAIVGYDDKGTYTSNYYHGCTVNGTINATNVGIGSGDQSGARSVHTLTLSSGITATGESVEISSTTYYAAGTTVTLGYTGTVSANQIVVYSVGTEVLSGNSFTMTAADATVSAEVLTEWEWLNRQFAAASTDSENPTLITLDQDYTAQTTDGYLTIPSRHYVTLDLNGHTLNRNLTAATANGYVIEVNGTLTLTDGSAAGTGTITGGSGNNGSGVRVYGTFTMNGGTISGNTATSGGGVYVQGTFNMNGGTISGNTATSGGGVYVYNDKTINISGNPVITGNTLSNNTTANNVYLKPGSVITVTDALTNTANIGVIMQNNTGVFTSGLNGNGTVANFTCDNSSECGVYLNGNGEASIIVDVWGIPDGADGTSEATAYTITTTRDLDLLATRVNSGMGYGADSEHPNGFFFQLGADITYAHKEANEEGADKEDNYTAIGTSQKYSFCGTFDGKDHTISGIRIYKGESKNQGLFGYVYGGTVKNVTLSDAHITGKQNVGGIVGHLTNYDNSTIGSINNCHVDGTVTIQAVVNSAESHGGIVGAGNGSVSNCTSSVTFIDSDGLTTCSKYGGIVGYATGGTISNCLAVGVTIPAVLKMGAIVAVDAGGTLTANYYLNCTVGGNTTNVGNGSVDPNGARSVHSLTLADGVTASGESVTIGTDTYYASNTNVTFTYNGSIPRGYVLDIKVKDANDNDIAVTYSNDTYTFKMPACDATVSGITDVWGIASGADGSEAHPYIITTTAGLDLLAKMVNGIDGYTADKFDGKFFKLGNDITYAHTTDWNDVTSTENNYISIGIKYDKEFWGTFDGDGHTISGIRIYKGNDECQGLFGYVRGTVKNVTLSDARITGCNNVGGIVGFLPNYTDQLIGTVNNCHVDGNVAIHTVVSNADYHGGIVGYSYSGTVINCTSQAVLTVADNLTGCDRYGGIVGQNDGNVSNCISSATIIVGNGVTNCRNYGGIIGQQYKGSVSSCLAIGATIPDVGYSKGAIAGRHDSGSLATNYYYNCTIGDVSNATSVGVAPKDINDNNNPEGAVAATILSESETVPGNLDGKVAFRREFTGGKASTICLPFALTDIEGGKAYEFVDVTYDAVDGWVATMNEVTATVANKPYLFLPEGSGSVPVLFHGTAGYDVSGGLATTSGDWTFTGTYTNLTYGTEPMTGHIYGFASKSKTVDGHDVEAGQFVHAKEGASVPPMRCYLTYKNGAQRAPMRASALGATGTDTDVPSRITVRLVSDSGTVTAVGTLDTVTGEMDINTWYDMNGRLLETEPTAPGLYIHNGKTIMIKK